MDAVLDLDTPLSNRGPRLSDLVFARLTEAILDGRLGDGEPLRDMEIARRLGVSRMPIREAVQRLERAGLVETSASRYTRVTALTEAHIAEAWEYGGFLYGGAARLAAERMTDAEREHALELLDAAAVGDPEESVAVMCRLFRHLLVSTDNRLMGGGLDAANMIERAMRAQCGAEATERLAAQRAILRDALVRHDGAAAEQAVRRMFGVA